MSNKSKSQSPKILAVDDDPQIRRLIERALRAEGYDVQTCPNADAAMTRLRGKNEGFSLVLVDIMMAGQTGIDFVRAIRGGEAGVEHSGLPVVFVTAEDDENNYEASFDLGAQRYVTKPFSTDELVGVVASVLHEAA